MEKEYKFKVDKEALKDFFLSDGEPTEKHLKEIKKVFNIVMIKHFVSYIQMSNDLMQYAVLAVLERRKSYDPSFSPYNYIYSIFRNEIGNKLRKLCKPDKEVYVEDILSFKERMVEDSEAELPQEIQRYKDYLTGKKDYTFIRIPKKDVLNLTIFLRSFESRRETPIPDFIVQTKNITKVLYRILKDIIEL